MLRSFIRAALIASSLTLCACSVDTPPFDEYLGGTRFHRTSGLYGASGRGVMPPDGQDVTVIFQGLPGGGERVYFIEGAELTLVFHQSGQPARTLTKPYSYCEINAAGKLVAEGIVPSDPADEMRQYVAQILAEVDQYGHLKPVQTGWGWPFAKSLAQAPAMDEYVAGPDFERMTRLYCTTAKGLATPGAENAVVLFERLPGGSERFYFLAGGEANLELYPLGAAGETLSQHDRYVEVDDTGMIVAEGLVPADPDHAMRQYIKSMLQEAQDLDFPQP